MESLIQNPALITFFNSESFQMICKLLLAAFLGALIGLERDIHGRSAGLRTHLLVALGSTLFMLISQNISGADPSRIAAQIVSGIGFLGAGAIMKEGITVRGLTTASCLWLVAALGMAVGIGHYWIAGVTTVIALFSLSLLNNFDKLFKRESYRILTISTPINTNTDLILKAIRGKTIRILFVDYNEDSASKRITLRITLRLVHRGDTDTEFGLIRSAIKKQKISVSNISWQHGELS